MSDLAIHLLASHGSSTPHGSPTGYEWANHFARAIKRNPQAHIDALVEAGVLKGETNLLNTTCYQVVQPHKHRWWVEAPDLLRRTVIARCSCGESREGIRNELPIEVPE